MTPNVNDTIGISEEITMHNSIALNASDVVSISELVQSVVNTVIDTHEDIPLIDWFYRMPLWLDISIEEPVTVEETVYSGVFIPEALHVDVDFNDGSEYYVSFSYDITDGVIYVYQGTQLVFNTGTMFDEEYDVVHIAERITIAIV